MGSQILSFSKPGRLAIAFALLVCAGFVGRAGAACSYTITPSDRTHGYGATTAAVSIATSSGCNWTVVNNNSWITILSATSGTGSKDVTYALTGNPNPGTRQGVIQIAGKNFTVTQTGVTCTYEISPTFHNKCPNSSTGSVQVSTPSPCPWTVLNPVDWIHITAGENSVGSGKVYFTVLENTGPTPRTAVLTIAGQPFTINQAAFASLTCPPNKQLECGSAWTFDAPSGSGSTPVVLSTTTNILCGGSYVASRAWSFSDTCGNLGICTQAVTVLDSIPPVLICAPNKSADCMAPWNFDAPTATDACDPAAPTIQVVSTVTNQTGPCTFSATRVWRATDSCGNASTCSQTMTISDTTPPVMTCAGNKSVECGTAWTFNSPGAVDACSGAVGVQIVSTVTNNSGFCGGSFSATRTWSAADSCGNASQCSQTVTVTDTTPPVITCAANKSVECGTAWIFDPPVAIDSCSGAMDVQIVSTVTNRTGFCGNNFSAMRTWGATDNCGNFSLCSQTVTVMDTTPPVITCAGDKVVECGSGWIFDPPTATDSCNEAHVLLLTTLTNTTGFCEGTYRVTRTWSALDACGNLSVCHQAVTVMDTTAPVMACAPNKTVECGAPWAFNPPTATDNCSALVTIQIVSTTTNTAGGCAGGFTATRTWSATDGCGNQATCSQTVSVMDTTPPTIVCANNKTVECGTPWAFDAPSASDSCSPDVTIQVVGTATNRAGFCGGTYSATRTWQATDSCGNAALCTQTVNVMDTQPPQLSCEPDRMVPCGTPWDFGVPAALDLCDGATVPVRVVSTVTNGNCGQTLTATRTWEAADRCGNKSTCQQTVTVMGVPMEALCAPNRSVNCADQWAFDEPTMQHGCGATVHLVGTVTNALCGKGLVATRTWAISDGCTNMTCRQTITVLDNPPLVVCAWNRTVSCDMPWNFEEPQVTDDCGYTLRIVSTVTNLLCGPSYVTTRTWEVADGCTNMLCSQTVEVLDQTPPMIVCLPDITVTNLIDVPHCAKSFTEFLMAGGQASDNCDSFRYRCIEGSLIPNSCGYTIERLHMVMDNCNNSNGCIQVIHIVTTNTTVSISVTAGANSPGADPCLGGDVTFCASPSGVGPFTFAWLKDGQPIAGQTGPCLNVPNLLPADAGHYCVSVAGACDTVTNCVTLPPCQGALARPVIAQINLLSSGGIKLKITGTPGQSYNVLRGTEIGKPWNIIGTVTMAASGSIEFVDPNGISGVCRMYQVVKP